MRRSASLLTRAALASRCSLCSGGDQRRTGALSKLTSPCLLLLRQFFCVSLCLFGCSAPRRPRDRGHPSSRAKLFRRRGDPPFLLVSRGAQPAGFCATSKQTRQTPADEATVGRAVRAHEFVDSWSVCRGENQRDGVLHPTGRTGTGNNRHHVAAFVGTRAC